MNKKNYELLRDSKPGDIITVEGVVYRVTKQRERQCIDCPFNANGTYTMEGESQDNYFCRAMVNSHNVYVKARYPHIPCVVQIYKKQGHWYGDECKDFIIVGDEFDDTD